jgi:hypothetical protein
MENRTEQNIVKMHFQDAGLEFLGGFDKDRT